MFLLDRPDIFKSKVLHLVLFVALLYIALLFYNYILGTSSIIDAHNHQFRGGPCGGCESWYDSFCDENLCNKKSGFDQYYLWGSLPALGFMVGFFIVFINETLVFSLLMVLLISGGFMLLVEVLSRIFGIPVLFTNFMEGIQSLFLGPFSRYGLFSFLLIFSSVFASLFGNIVAFLLRALAGKLLKSKS